MRRQGPAARVPVDPEIEKTCRQNRRNKRLEKVVQRIEQEEVMANNGNNGGAVEEQTNALKFLSKFFLPAKAAKLRGEINNFYQLDNEALYEAWERFKDLIRKCPHHGIEKWMLVHNFYNGLGGTTRTLIDAAAGGAFMRKSANEAYDLLEEMAMNNQQWPSERSSSRKVAGMYEVDAISKLTAQVEALTKQLQGNIITAQCQYADVNNMPMEQAQAIENFPRQSNNNPYSNSFNQGWRNHPNFSWKNDQQGQSSNQQQPQGFFQPRFRPQQQPQPPTHHQQQQNFGGNSNAQSDVLNQFMAETRSSIRNLETQMGQLDTLMANRAQGNLPSTTESRSERELQGNHAQAPAKEEKKHSEKKATEEALEQMPSYVKFMKDILSKKRKMEDFETVALTEECSAILQKKLPPKLRDLGSFTIPCTIGRIEGINALCDLGASINLMPLSVFKRLQLGEAKPTIVTLQLVDRSLAHPRGVIEDVLVKVEKFIFPVDFKVLDMEEDNNVPIILGRPFLATGQALIDVQKGELKLRVKGEEVVFNVLKAMTYPEASDNCFSVDVMGNLVEERKLINDPLELSLVEDEISDQDGKEAMEYAKWLNSYGPLKRKYFEELGAVPKRSLPSVEKPPELELKVLPDHLRYEFLGENKTLPVIVSASLSDVETEKLL
ncbi:uncharacterized protein LOC133795570 [Humulus lupulus]|uniref:uncharacterized protein LOC133795570 n=1 Tax=Humulus lupulus TaxID=3486 RepID=UPI002B41763D|nr:uncharacterized protein LOC133795570 [Humulus lupulus]